MGGKAHISANGMHANAMSNVVARVKNGLFGTLFVLQKDAPASSRVVSVLLGTIIKMFQVRWCGGGGGWAPAGAAGCAGDVHVRGVMRGVGRVGGRSWRAAAAALTRGHSSSTSPPHPRQRLPCSAPVHAPADAQLLSFCFLSGAWSSLISPVSTVTGALTMEFWFKYLDTNGYFTLFFFRCARRRRRRQAAGGGVERAASRSPTAGLLSIPHPHPTPHTRSFSWVILFLVLMLYAGWSFERGAWGRWPRAARPSLFVASHCPATC
jgi:hypothetical protein